MPPKTKCQKTLEEAAKRAREGAKRRRLEQGPTDGAGPSSVSQNPPCVVPPSNRERSIITPADSEMSEDPTFDPEKELETDSQLQFAEEWSISLDRDDKVSLGLFLSYHLEQLLGLSKTMAAEYTGMMLGKSERTIRQWKADFVENGYEVPES